LDGAHEKPGFDRIGCNGDAGWDRGGKGVWAGGTGDEKFEPLSKSLVREEDAKKKVTLSVGGWIRGGEKSHRRELHEGWRVKMTPQACKKMGFRLTKVGARLAKEK